MKLYHHPLSSSSRKVTMTAHTLGVHYQERLIDLAHASDRAALVAINPNNKVPVLVDGDLVLWESHAIMQYLCALTPEQSLYPEAARARADVNRWLFWLSSHLTECIGGLNFENIWKKAIGLGDADPETVARHERDFHDLVAVLDAHLEGRTWMSGDAVTLADLSAAATFMYLGPARLPIKPYANVLAWFSRMKDLDAWKATAPPATFA